MYMDQSVTSNSIIDLSMFFLAKCTCFCAFRNEINSINPICMHEHIPVHCIYIVNKSTGILWYTLAIISTHPLFLCLTTCTCINIQHVCNIVQKQNVQVILQYVPVHVYSGKY